MGITPNRKETEMLTHTVTFTVTVAFDAANQSPEHIIRQLRTEIEDAIDNVDLSGTNADERGQICQANVSQTR